MKRSSKKYGLRITGVGKFGKWLENNMREHELTCVDLANMLDVTRQRITMHINKSTFVSFPNVVTYCWAFGMKDDPYKIYELVKEDWGR